ncbi:hypothetical protein ARMSODRAFT_1023811 [Armillaria solidipes]|uniref:Uncharacterized protein n=1 Tax=Armillaria solidipes TaxID=1076256 RepID=A0A2H3B1L0_9AGAR|nr:hypothetical protein ARMSODRAFT_1023811 [Armillaria solidipes]
MFEDRHGKPVQFPRTALAGLRGPGVWQDTLRELRNEDLKNLDGADFTIDRPEDEVKEETIYENGHKRKGKKYPRTKPGEAETFRLVSWIWLMEGTLGGPGREREMHETIKLEWLKSRARVNRWTEELALMVEEMRRVLVTLEKEAVSWEERRGGYAELTARASEGLAAYADRQAALLRQLASWFGTLWNGERGCVRAPARTADEAEVEEAREEEVQASSDAGGIDAQLGHSVARA